tara:strand:- start:260 stop:412 length:153 start_codon:yes stop_codon:yes gene_type:complete
MILEVIFGVIILSVMAIFAWESVLRVEEQKKHGVSSGEQQSKKKHMDDIL